MLKLSKKWTNKQHRVLSQVLELSHTPLSCTYYLYQVLLHFFRVIFY